MNSVKAKHYLVLAILATGTIPWSTLCAGQYVQAPLPTGIFRITSIITAFTYCNILLLLLLVPNLKGKGRKIDRITHPVMINY